MGELASSESVFLSSIIKSLTRWNPDALISRKGYAIIDKMRTDETVKASLTLKTQAVTAPGWFIEAASDDPKDIEIADFVEFALNKMHGSVTDAIGQILLALSYGFSINEIVWKRYETGEHAGKIGIKALKSKRPRYYIFDTDKFSNLTKKGLINTIEGEEALPIDKFIIYTYQKEFGNWYGQSDLIPAYRAWWSKDNIIKFWNIALEKFGMPTTWGQYSTSDPSQISKLQTILNNIQSNTNITSQKDHFDISFLEPLRKSGGDYKEALNYHDRSIAKAILMPDDVSDASNGEGSNARASVRFDVFLIIIDKLRQDIEEIVMEEQLIRRLVAFNYSDVSELPKFKFKAMTQEQKLGLAESWGNLVQKGAVRSTMEDENHIRDMIGFPENNEEIEEEVIERKPDEEELKAAEEKKLSKDYIEREKTRYEKQVNFQQIDKELIKGESNTTKLLQEWLTKQRDDLYKFVTKKMEKNELSTKIVLDLNLRFKSDMKKTIKGMFDSTYSQGKTDGKKELPSTFATTGKQGIEVAPDKALKYLQDKSDFVIKGINDPLLGDIQRRLLDAIKTGKSIPNTIKTLEEAYEPYLNDGTVIENNKILEPYRLEAIVRTNMSEAYNEGRRAIGEDPDLEGFVLGYQFSEILDSRTVAVSKFADGKTIKINDPRLPELTYPLHWQDRGLFVYVTKDMAPIEWTPDSEIDQLLSMARTTKP